MYSHLYFQKRPLDLVLPPQPLGVTTAHNAQATHWRCPRTRPRCSTSSRGEQVKKNILEFNQHILLPLRMEPWVRGPSPEGLLRLLSEDGL